MPKRTPVPLRLINEHKAGRKILTTSKNTKQLRDKYKALTKPPNPPPTTTALPSFINLSEILNRSRRTDIEKSLSKIDPQAPQQRLDQVIRLLPHLWVEMRR
ncbi:hypothetical protein ACJMK2_005411 [Sinanodonta woodiana]|uniref:Uncharacterized protein n=1 Tax=Sinanodonta woodiana TaxID=1069815 RepID=A0ABD3VSN5_SINWO